MDNRLINKIITADALQGLKTLPDSLVDMCVTSPPYYGLRDYGTDGQIGLEETPELYIQKLVDIFREVHRVLRDDGTLWVNIGDSYNRYKGNAFSASSGSKFAGFRNQPTRTGGYGLECKDLKPKDLIGILWMLAFALRADGWYLRQDIIWHKPNPMPESITDRCTKSHEYIFLFSKSEKYLFNHKDIMEIANYDGRKDTVMKGSNKYNNSGIYPSSKQQTFTARGCERWQKDEDGNFIRNKRDVWTVNTKPYQGAHFAVFPPALIRPCILAGSRRGGGVVLDPFFGSGATGQVAIEEGRNYIGIELNPDYVELANKRLEKATSEINLVESTLF